MARQCARTEKFCGVRHLLQRKTVGSPKKLLEPRFAPSVLSIPARGSCAAGEPAFDATQLETLRRYGRSTEGKKAAARQMGISLATLYRHLRRDQEDGAR